MLKRRDAIALLAEAALVSLLLGGCASAIGPLVAVALGGVVDADRRPRGSTYYAAPGTVDLYAPSGRRLGYGRLR